MNETWEEIPSVKNANKLNFSAFHPQRSRQYDSASAMERHITTYHVVRIQNKNWILTLENGFT